MDVTDLTRAVPGHPPRDGRLLSRRLLTRAGLPSQAPKAISASFPNMPLLLALSHLVNQKRSNEPLCDRVKRRLKKFVFDSFFSTSLLLNFLLNSLSTIHTDNWQ